MLDQIQHIYVIGLGAMGALYASKLYDYNPELVHVILDEQRKTRYEHDGFWVNNKKYDFDYVTPEQSRHAPKADLIIIGVKAAQLHEAIELCREILQPKTRIISLLNGISSENMIAEQLGPQHPFYAYGVAMDATRQDTHVNYSKAGFLVFGEQNNQTPSHDVQQVQYLFEQAQIPYQTPVDMQYALWKKFMLNVAANQVTAILKIPYGEVKKNQYVQQLMFSAAQEVLDIAHVAGIALTEQDHKEILTPMLQLNDQAYTSMCQDILAKRKTEVAIFGETVIQLGLKYHVATPVNQVLVSMIHAIEASF